MEFLDIFALKHKDWEYEKEYRLIGQTDYEHDKYTCNIDVKNIYMSKDISQLHEDMIVKAINTKNDEITKKLEGRELIKLYKMKPCENNLFEFEAIEYPL